MKSFSYSRATTSAQAIQAAKVRSASFLAGGTNLVDLMKYRVEQPAALVDINHLALAEVTPSADGGVAAALAGAVERSVAAASQHGEHRRQPHAADPLLLLHRRRFLSLQQTQPRLRMCRA
jgi:CO/xanthine dehydrogenase FAD-binding subunit